jgi:ABC-type transport system involved in multi-copper enzyme maturation permease subunit
MRGRLGPLFRKEIRQISRSRRTVIAASFVPLIMLTFVTLGDILVLKLGFGSHPIYMLSSARSVSGSYLLRHYTLPVLVTISALVTPSIVMGDLLFGERYRRTLELLVALPVSAADVVLAKLAAVLSFAFTVTVPIFLLNVVIVSSTGYATAQQEIALALLLLASICYSASSALLIAVIADEPRAANIVAGLVLGPIVPLEGLVLAAVPGIEAIVISAVCLVLLAIGALFWSTSLLSFERLFGSA